MERLRLAPTAPREATLDSIPRAPGTYLLVLRSRQGVRIEVGRLGPLEVAPGVYLYVGSAFGPGGLRARVGHHLGAARRPHWHIDYLRAVAGVEAVWYVADGVRREHIWAARLMAAPGVHVPQPGFGASDCGCVSHLFHVPSWSPVGAKHLSSLPHA